MTNKQKKPHDEGQVKRKGLQPGAGGAKAREAMKERQLTENYEEELERMRQKVADLEKENGKMRSEIVKVGEQNRKSRAAENPVCEQTLTEAHQFLLNNFIASNWFTNNKFTTRSTLEKDTRFMTAFVRSIQVPSNDGTLYQRAIVRAVMKKVTALRAHVKRKIRDGYEGNYNGVKKLALFE